MENLDKHDGGQMVEQPREMVADGRLGPSKPKRVIHFAIAIFLLLQILIPASYYFNDSQTSERFSWRMFSSVDLSTWDTKVTALVESPDRTNTDGLIEQEIPIHAQLQETYVKSIQRAQFDIVEPYMRKLAEQPGVKEVRFVAKGKFPSGKSMTPIRLSLRAGGPLVKGFE